MRATSSQEHEKFIPEYLSASEVKKQLKELEVIYHNQSLLEKVTRPITHILASFVNPFVSYYHNANGLKSYLAENLLRHYYNGHETLGTGTADAVVAKVSRAAHGRSRNNAGPAQRAIAAYEHYIVETPGAKPEWSQDVNFELYSKAHGETLPTKLLECLKDELLAKGKALKLQGTLAAVIFVIQDKCGITVINLETINSEIAAAKEVKTPSAQNKSSFWSNLNPLNYLPASSSKEASSAERSFI